MTGWILNVVEPGGTARQVPATDGLTIGRAPDNGLVLKDAKVSGKHAKITASGGGVFIEDLGSANKTIVDGGPTLDAGQKFELQDGQTIKIGLTVLNVRAPVPAVEKTELISDDVRADVAAKI
jgi:pSer/pThr/pTyr-binding forkhead associated (FHA) protein